MSSDEQRKIVQDYVSAQKRFEREKREFESIKKKFYSSCENYYENNGRQKTYDFGGLVLTRIQSASISFDADAIEKALPKDYRNDVIAKSYSITDMDGLVKYLKSIGADPRVFKTFLTVSKTVDAEALDQLESLGKIDAKTLENCYTVTKRNPYFKVHLKEQAEDGAQCSK